MFQQGWNNEVYPGDVREKNNNTLKNNTLSAPSGFLLKDLFKILVRPEKLRKQLRNIRMLDSNA